MGAFEYTALDSRGKQKKGILEADSVRHASQLLKDKALIPLKVEGTTGQSGSSRATRHFDKLTHRERSLVTRQMATLLQSSLPIDDVLMAVSRQSASRRINRIFPALRSKIREGYSFAEALGQFPRSFSTLYLSTVAAGEASGNLDKVLEQLADYEDSAREHRQKVQLALIYPVLLLVLSIIIVTGLMIFVVPDVISVFSTTGQELPVLTRILVDISDFITNHGLILMVCLVLIGVAVSRALKVPSILLQVHRFVLHAPLLQSVTRNSQAARYTGTLSILVKSGVPLLDAMKIAKGVITNRYLLIQVEEAVNNVMEGGSLSSALEQTGYFPPIMIHMIASGEGSGRLDEMLGRAASQQQKDLQAMVITVVSLLEPVMLILMGIVVMLIVLAIMLPILNLNQLIN